MAPVYGLAENAVAVTLPPPGRVPVIDRIERARLSTRGIAEPARPTIPAPSNSSPAAIRSPITKFASSTMRAASSANDGKGGVEFRGPSATSGYFQNPAKTRELFHDGWLDTGDRGYMAGGDLFITGRIKDIIIRAGQHIAPHEIEEAVGAVPGLRKNGVAAFGVTDPASGTERVVVLAETEESDPAVQAALKVRAQQAATHIVGGPPDEVVLVQPGTVPKTASGKIRRAAARDLYLGKDLGVPQRAVWWQLARLASPGLACACRSFGASTRRSPLCRLVVDGDRPLAFLLGWLAVMTAAAPGLAMGGDPHTRSHRVQGARDSRCRSAASIESRIAARCWRSITQAIWTRSSWLRPFPASRLMSSRRSLRDQIFAGFAAAAPRRAVSRPIRRGRQPRGSRSVRPLRHGKSGMLVFFPEGTFTRRAGLSGFYLGAFRVAAQAKLPVVPGILRGTRSMLRAISGFRAGARSASASGIPFNQAGPILPPSCGFATPHGRRSCPAARSPISTS